MKPLFVPGDAIQPCTAAVASAAMNVPAVLVVTEARKFKARVTISKGTQEVDATNVLEVMTLGAAQGEELSLEGSGDDAQDAVDAVEQLFLRKFDEE